MHRLRLFFFFSIAVIAIGFAYFGALVVSGPSGPEEAARNRAEQDMASGSVTFLTWYNGSENHDVWGIGTVYAAGTPGKVKCGGRSVPLTPTYDTRSDTHYPKTEQTKVFARAYNLAVLDRLGARGINCEF